MKKITFLFCLLFAFSQISAQTTVTIGTGTTASATGTNASPIYRSSAASTFNFSQSVELLTASDLSAVGITAGSTITKIAYNKTNAFTLSPGRSATVNIYLKNSSTTALAGATNFATYITGATQCYSNAAVTATEIPGVAGWVEFTFSTPFNYTGGSIEVGINWAINAGAGNATTGGFAWQYTAVTGNQAAGTSDSVAITGNLTTTATRIYNTQLTYTNSPCSGIPAPGNTLAPSPICAGSSATLTLQNATIGSGVTYQWFMNAVAIPGATSGVYVIPSVTSTENYYCEVTCATNTTASSTIAVGPTLLTAPTTIEPFNTFLPSCWLFGDNGDLTAGPATFGANSWKFDGFANVGTTGSIAYNHFTTAANDWIISPVINVPSTGYELKFDASLTQWNGTVAPTTPWDAGDVVEVLVSTTGLNNWTVVYTIDNANAPAPAGSAIVVDLDTYATQNIRVAYRVVSGAVDTGDDTDIFIDNFQVRLSPTCPDQTGLVVSGITGSGANTSWDDLSGSGSIGYQYAITTSATPPATGTATASTFYVASGLLPQTVYYLHVRSECAGSTYGNWATTTFTTGCAPITALPHIEPFATFLPNCWSEADNGDLLAGPATTGTGSWLVDGLGNVGTTGAIRVTLDAATDNDWVLSPEFTIPALGYELKFIAAANQGGSTNAPTTTWESDDFVEVLITTTNNTNWTPLFTYTDTNVPLNTGSINVLDLDAYSGQTVRFAFRAVEGASNGTASIDFSVDDFEVRLTPPCADQTGLVVSGITGSGANTSWDDMSGTGAIGYEYAITTSATPPASGTAIASTFYIASGLLPQTVYYLHVRTECSGSLYGAWATTTFTTGCAPITVLPHLEPFDTFLPNCWSEADNGDLIAGPATSGAGSWLVDGLGNVGTTGAIRVTLDAATDNDWVVSPEFTIPALGYELKFIAAANQGGSTNAPTTAWESDDFIEVLATTTNNNNWTPLYTFNNTNVPSNVGSINVLDLDAYSGQTVRFAFRAVEGATNGAASVDFSVDNFEVRLTPPCADQTGLVVSGITGSGANTSWDDMSGTGSIGYEYAVTTSATPPASGTATTNTFYIASGLAPQTVYYLHVRTECSGSVYGTWSTTTFTTACAPLVALPWTENFDTLTPGTNVFPTCWNYSNTTSTWSISTTPVAYSGANSLRRTWSTDGWAFTPLFTLTAGTSYTFSYYVRTNDAIVGYDVTVGVGNSQNSAAMTNTLSAVVGYQGPTWTLVSIDYTPTISGDYSFGIHVVAPVAPNGINFDNFELKLSPTLPPACTTNLVATPNATCGNFSNNLTWNAEPTASGYYVTIGTTSGGTDIANAVSVGLNSYSFTGSVNTQYFWTIVPFNAAGPATGCAEQSFTTVATGCYCASLPTSNDGIGITTAVVGATSNPIADVTYVDLTTAAEVVAQGANTNVQLTFSTGFTYDINIWIDFNNDFDFDDAGELVKTGIASTNVQPNTVDASFTMPLTAPTGTHRMRIGTADTGQVPPNPCYSGSFGVTLDFTVDTVLNSNSFDTTSFVAYPNPVKDVLNLSYKTAISNVRIINLLGQEVLNTRANTNDVQVNMSALTAGAYIVNITVEDTVHTIKVIKE